MKVSVRTFRLALVGLARVVDEKTNNVSCLSASASDSKAVPASLGCGRDAGEQAMLSAGQQRIRVEFDLLPEFITVSTRPLRCQSTLDAFSAELSPHCQKLSAVLRFDSASQPQSARR